MDSKSENNSPRLIRTIAAEIQKTWSKVSPYAEPYLEAMLTLDTIEDNYFFDDGKHMIQVMDGDEPAGVAELPLDFYEELKSEFAPRLPDIRKDEPFIDRQWAIKTLKLGSKTNN